MSPLVSSQAPSAIRVVKVARARTLGVIGVGITIALCVTVTSTFIAERQRTRTGVNDVNHGTDQVCAVGHSGCGYVGVAMLEWTDIDLWVIDEDGLPAAMECEFEGKAGYAIIAFTDTEEARRYQYLAAPNMDMRFVRRMARKRLDDRLLQVDLVRAARVYLMAKMPRPVLAMVVNPAAPAPTWVSIEDVVTHGRKRRAVKSALDELDG